MPRLRPQMVESPELMLNYVEAYVELNGNFPDLTDNIDLIRARVGMPTLTSVRPAVTASSPNYGYAISEALEIVRQERRVELAGEGYKIHNAKLTAAVNAQLNEFGQALIIDCHSFPANPLKRDINKNPEQPAYNIGTDPFHTPGI